MIHRIFSVFDEKAEAFLQPLFMQTRGLAIRSFQAAVNDPGHTFSKYSADFVMYEIGTFDDVTGEVCKLDSFHRIGSAFEFLDTPEKPALKEVAL